MGTADPVWCRNRIDETQRGIGAFVKVEEGLYERDRAACNARRGGEATGADVLPMAFRFLAAWVGVWVARQQADQIEHLKTVNRSLMDVNELPQDERRFVASEP